VVTLLCCPGWIARYRGAFLWIPVENFCNAFP
jgi:hypothetical protein